MSFATQVLSFHLVRRHHANKLRMHFTSWSSATVAAAYSPMSSFHKAGVDRMNSSMSRGVAQVASATCGLQEAYLQQASICGSLGGTGFESCVSEAN